MSHLKIQNQQWSFWQIISISICERSSDVVDLSVQEEKRQCLYLTAINVQHLTLNSSVTALTDFFAWYHSNLFSKTRLYSEVLRFYASKIRVKSFDWRKWRMDNQTCSKSLLTGRMHTVHHKQNNFFVPYMSLINITDLI